MVAREVRIKDGKRETTICRYVAAQLEGSSYGGKMEGVEDTAYNTYMAVARLIEILASKDIISLDEVGFIATGDRLKKLEKG